jgi:hypothetical protein
MPHGHAYAAPVPARVTTCEEISRETSWSPVLRYMMLSSFLILEKKVCEMLRHFPVWYDKERNVLLERMMPSTPKQAAIRIRLLYVCVCVCV